MTATPEPKTRILPMTDAELDDYKLHRRFDRIGRLVGDPAMKRLMDAHVMIIGLGGVGSFAAESVVRSGVGRISLVDFDLVCITNFNRQLHALHGQVGKPKTEVMLERLRLINPWANITAQSQFYNAEHADEILATKPDVIIDAIDHVTSKCHLLARCRADNIPVICSTGSSGRLDPTLIRVADLAHTTIDPLARTVRSILREQYDFPKYKGDPFGIQAVYSIERPTEPVELHYDMGKGFRCVCPQGDNPYFTCESRHVIWGSSSFVTGSFGLACGSVAVKALLNTETV